MLARTCASWPIRAGSVFRKEVLKRQDGRRILKKKGCFLSIKACTPVLAVTQNKIMDLKMSMRSPLRRSDAYSTVSHPLLHVSAHCNHKLRRQPSAMHCEEASIVFISVCAQCSPCVQGNRDGGKTERENNLKHYRLFLCWGVRGQQNKEAKIEPLFAVVQSRQRFVSSPPRTYYLFTAVQRRLCSTLTVHNNRGWC